MKKKKRERTSAKIINNENHEKDKGERKAGKKVSRSGTKASGYLFQLQNTFPLISANG